MRFSHFLGNVIGYVLYFSLLGVLRIFAPRGYFRKKHMGRREGLSLSTAYWLNYTLYTCDKILNTFSYTNFVSVLRVPRRYFCCGSLLFLLSVFILWFIYYVSDIFCKF